ncbi:MAG: hypothetical protein FWG92_05005 [Leptospirales bacterium]|nr:hypothetical protein [Leptospirales bacterium]
MIIEEKNALNCFWTNAGHCDDLVLSTRVRLARNVMGFLFPHKGSAAEAAYIISLFEKFAVSINGGNGNFVRLKGLDKNTKRMLRESNIITLETEISDKSAVFFDDDYSILVNEEDHIRIQVVYPGLQLKEAFEKADKIDDELNAFIPYSFSTDYGYLTACPTNLGTGMKVSAMLHLPALGIKKSVQSISTRIQNDGAAISGTIIKNGSSMGNIYQVFNKVSLGLSEIDIIELMDGIISEIVHAEDEARDELFANSRSEIEDMVWRSYAIVSSARRMSYYEAMEHLLNIRFGIILAFIKEISLALVNNLMINIQPAHLSQIFDRSFSDNSEIDEVRAYFLRTNFCMRRGDV